MGMHAPARQGHVAKTRTTYLTDEFVELNRDGHAQARIKNECCGHARHVHPAELVCLSVLITLAHGGVHILRGVDEMQPSSLRQRVRIKNKDEIKNTDMLWGPGTTQDRPGSHLVKLFPRPAATLMLWLVSNGRYLRSLLLCPHKLKPATWRLRTQLLKH